MFPPLHRDGFSAGFISKALYGSNHFLSERLPLFTGCKGDFSYGLVTDTGRLPWDFFIADY